MITGNSFKSDQVGCKSEHAKMWSVAAGSVVLVGFFFSFLSGAPVAPAAAEAPEPNAC